MKESVAKVIDPEIQAERKQKFVNGLKNLAQNVGSSAISVGGSLLNTGLSYLLNRKQMRDQADLQRQQYDYELNAESPENQRKRLESAGLNPALMYQNGQGGTISATMGTPSALPIQGSNLGTSILQGMETMARIRNLDQNTAKQKTETDYNYESMQSRLAMVSSEALLKKYGAEIKAIDAIYHEEVTRENLAQLRKFIDKLSFDMSNAKDLTDLEREKVRAYVNDLIKKHSLWESQIDLNKAKTTTEGTQQELNLSNSMVAKAESARLEFDNKMQHTIGYRPGWNVWQMLAGVYQKAVFVGDYQEKVEQVPEDVEKSVKTWFDKLKPEEQKIIKENLKNFIWQLN